MWKDRVYTEIWSLQDKQRATTLFCNSCVMKVLKTRSYSRMSNWFPRDSWITNNNKYIISSSGNSLKILNIQDKQKFISPRSHLTGKKHRDFEWWPIDNLRSWKEEAIFNSTRQFHKTLEFSLKKRNRCSRRPHRCCEDFSDFER